MTREVPERFIGLDSLEARNQAVEILRTEERLRKEEDYTHSVGHCYKCGTVIQPLVKEQWFLKVKPLAERAIKVIENGEITFTPKNKAQVLVNYYKNLKDWNLSRQIPWGIPIPALQSSKDPAKWIFDSRVDQKEIEVDGIAYHREEDTFDTWFSSGQWPFITTDYLEGGELSKYYPLSLMETAGEILFAWVARMIMLGLFATDQVPFKHVYLHGLVLDEHGQKMSKSRGNVINPQEPMRQYGSDALRIGLLMSRSPAVNQAYTPGSVIAGRNFANKLWNVARFIEDKIGDDYKKRAPEPQTIADYWILDRLNKASSQVAKLMEAYRFAEAVELMYHTVWDDLADWYIECSKVNYNSTVLSYSLETVLKLAHPFAPFVTETIWQTLGWEKTLLINSVWPEATITSAVKAKKFTDLQVLVSEARLVSISMANGKQTLVFTNDPLIEVNQQLIGKLAGLKAVRKVGKGRGLRLAIAGTEAWLDIDEHTLQKHRDRLQARLDEAGGRIKQIQARLSNKGYINNAPATVVAETREQLAQQESLQERLAQELKIARGS
jgi:valyl-tRNA synthetase